MFERNATSKNGQSGWALNTPEPSVNEKFWAIILRSWDMPTIEIHAEYAADVERSVQW